jgi:metal-responsive CopG/Arc/MetJ family transcriptional regulator
MESESVRLNITLPKNIVIAMEQFTAPRKRSQFIAKAIQDRINQQKKEELDELLIEGYQARSKENVKFSTDYESVDLEGWDEY